MAENEGQERTEAATGKRIEDARKKGDIPRSRELNTLVMLLSSALCLLVFGGYMAGSLQDILRNSFSIERAQIYRPDAMLTTLVEQFGDMLLLLSPLFVVLMIASVAGPLLMGGWNFSMEALTLKPDKLNPISGMKRIFSVNSLQELVKSIIKFVLITALTILLFMQQIDEILGLGQESLEGAMGHAGALIVWTFLVLAASLVLIAAVDVPFQLWSYARKLRMTKQEIKDESKETDGRPEVKGRIRTLQREMAQRRMMENIPTADVVVTNPTHYAVALKYDASRMGAPRVVAKGADLIAAQIRAVAGEHKVPLLSAPPLARALFFSTELDQEIPAGLYLAVAQVLAYIYQVKTAKTQGGAAPNPPKDLPVPPEFEQMRKRRRH